MNVEVTAVEENRGTRKVGNRLVVVPDSTSYVVWLKLEDGRPAYLVGSGEPPVKPGDVLATPTR